MNIDLNSVLIENINLDAEGYEEIYQNLQVLYTTPEVTVPFDRGFGINLDILDNPLHLLEGKLIVEYTEKTRRFEPRASVKEVTFDYTKDGTVIPKVVIDIDSNA